MAGIIVQIVSIVCSFIKNRLVVKLKNNATNKWATNIVIKIKISNEWS